MSFFGKNIRKIRSVKSLSQQAFAELFDLKRGTLGAYEEGRSEPRIETIIMIAKHFSIPIDDLLTQELTVNKLLKFKGNLASEDQELVKEQFAKIPCIIRNNSRDYLLYYNKEEFIKRMPCLCLPLNRENNYRGYTVDNLEMSSNDKGLFPKDVVIGEYVPQKEYKNLDNGSLVLVVLKDMLVLRRLYITNAKVVLRAEHKNIEEITATLKEVKEMWRICYVFYHRLPPIGEALEDKLLYLEREMEKIRSKM
ncbi:DNA-binding transcriptional regulator, XRE-family HTH domain [Salinimicrobium sediminis]|uniref:DNA-binding transcriptional regulator, XRE-family HTH domain n=1 Tax=Salinimicrobium sediminis TaxID=1343891 RepID=A0A285X2N1_9FLAO|nr:helix-turn-helix transcriptional regulator [Salinimicrobium sediminis]MDX1753237.1 helix-turn-helix transcriptional regulator [Salinimicrobium sediminis]SOC79620.1 DNA-binding transcriptional regulator, XRE-family HTH domain [Salinimicrobium sediminis]